MPRKTSKPRKAGPVDLPPMKNRRGGRPDPTGPAQAAPPKTPQRDKRFGRRPPKFPGRLGGR